MDSDGIKVQSFRQRSWWNLSWRYSFLGFDYHCPLFGKISSLFCGSTVVFDPCFGAFSLLHCPQTLEDCPLNTIDKKIKTKLILQKITREVDFFSLWLASGLSLCEQNCTSTALRGFTHILDFIVLVYSKRWSPWCMLNNSQCKVPMMRITFTRIDWSVPNLTLLPMICHDTFAWMLSSSLVSSITHSSVHPSISYLLIAFERSRLQLWVWVGQWVFEEETRKSDRELLFHTACAKMQRLVEPPFNW